MHRLIGGVSDRLSCDRFRMNRMFVRMEPLSLPSRARRFFWVDHTLQVFAAEGLPAHTEANVMRSVNGRSSVKEKHRINQIIESLRKAERAEANHGRRAAQRLPFVRPVIITVGRDKQTQIKATSKDLSQTGMGVIHEVGLEVGRIGVVTIYRLHDDPLMIRAECRWCQTFCKSWFVSGWRFLAEERW